MQWQKSNFWQAADDGKCPVSAAELGGAALGHAAPKSMLLHHHAACAEQGTEDGKKLFAAVAPVAFVQQEGDAFVLNFYGDGHGAGMGLAEELDLLHPGAGVRQQVELLPDCAASFGAESGREASLALLRAAGTAFRAQRP